MLREQVNNLNEKFQFARVFFSGLTECISRDLQKHLVSDLSSLNLCSALERVKPNHVLPLSLHRQMCGVSGKQSCSIWCSLQSYAIAHS